MKAYFDTNHNPDAKDLKQLEHETKLSKRVLQVIEKLSTPNLIKLKSIFPKNERIYTLTSKV